MASNVMFKPTGSGVFNGSALVAVTKTGLISVMHPISNRIPNSGQVDSRLRVRFDDPTYYTA